MRLLRFSYLKLDLFDLQFLPSFLAANLQPYCVRIYFSLHRKHFDTKAMYETKATLDTDGVFSCRLRILWNKVQLLISKFVRIGHLIHLMKPITCLALVRAPSSYKVLCLES